MPDTPQPSPIPPRFWWLKRLAVAVPLVLLGVLTLRLIWGHRANQRLEATVQAIAARGEPIRFEDMVVEPVPDKDNKAYYLEQALANWPTVPGLGVSILDTDWYSNGYPSNPNAPPDPITDNRAYLDQCGPVFELLRQAEQAPSVDWHIHFQSPLIYNWNAIQHYHSMRRLTALMVDASARAHALGDSGTVFQLVDSTYTIAAAIDAPPNFTIGHLVADSIRARAYSTLEPLLPTTTIDATSRPFAEHLLQTLLDEQINRQGLMDGWTSDRWYSYDTCAAVLSGTVNIQNVINYNYGASRSGDLSHYLIMTFFKPIVSSDTAFVLDYESALIAASKHIDSYSAFIAHLPSQQVTNDQRQLHLLADGFLPSLEGLHQAHFQVLSMQRLAATALAIKLYEADRGYRPATLGELVPDYLPAVPLDPYADDGSTVRYKPEGATRVSHDQQPLAENGEAVTPLPEPGVAIVYSVGTNHTDNGGRIYVWDNNTYDDNERFREYADLYFLLDPAPEPVETDDPNQLLGPIPEGFSPF